MKKYNITDIRNLGSEAIVTIKEIRKMTGMTQKQFSEYFGIPKRTIEDWEGERRKPTAYLVELIKYKLKNERLLEFD